MATCGTCGGTGQIVYVRSHIITDKTRKARCGTCSGSGESDYRSDPKYVRWQREARASFPVNPELNRRAQGAA